MTVTVKFLKETIIENGNGFYFIYKGKESGIIPCVENSIFTFQAWHGDKVKDYDNFNDAISDKFYSGKSIIDLIREKIPEFKL